jgi:hypothetical protein
MDALEEQPFADPFYWAPFILVSAGRTDRAQMSGGFDLETQ